MTASRDFGWWYWVITVGLLGAGLTRWTVELGLAMQPFSLGLVGRTFLASQTIMPPCGEVFQRPWLEQVQR